MKRAAQVCARALLALALAVLTLWSFAAIQYSNLPQALRLPAAIAFVALVGALWFLVKPRRRGRLAALAAFALLVAAWLAIPPSNVRDWMPDVAVLPWAEIAGERVTLHEIRACEYRSETDYTVRHHDQTFALGQLRSADLYMVYWGSQSIAHTMISFGFEDGSYVCFSIETRKEKGESYSAIRGFFKQYELTYVVADERDLVGLRTNFRHEDVYLYRLLVPREILRQVFLDYAQELNELKATPRWYNAATSNCTTNIRRHTAPHDPEQRWDWRVLINGRLDEMLYERGRLDTHLPFAELKRASRVNERALAAGDGADFSELIRRGLPGMPP